MTPFAQFTTAKDNSVFSEDSTMTALSDSKYQRSNLFEKRRLISVFIFINLFLVFPSSNAATTGIRNSQVTSYINFTRTYGVEPTPKVFLNTAELIEARDLMSEQHEVTTEDGYILSLYRASEGPTEGRTPILIIHGLLLSSDSWLVPKRTDSLPLVLVDAGYDVWLGDLRGNANSKRHKYLSPNSREFWDYSWHEYGVYDIPALIDYILMKTGSQKLTYIGHSAGARSFFVMTSMRPEYNDKILLALLLAPDVGIRNDKQFPLVELSLSLGETFANALSLFGMNEILPRNQFLMRFTKNVCEKRVILPLCMVSLRLSFRESLQNLDKSRAAFILSSLPAGTSAKLLAHFSQLYTSGRFQQFDYGERENLRRYNSTIPPEYDVSKITAPVALIYSLNDPFVNEAIVSKFAAKLQNLVTIYRIPQPEYSHLDYVIGTSSSRVLFPKLLELINDFNGIRSSLAPSTIGRN